MKKKIFVFPCGSEIGLEFHKALSYSTHFELIGGSSVSDHGEFVYNNYIADLPNVSDEDFINRLNDIIREHEIEYIFPAHDSVVLRLAQESAANNLACEVITSPVLTCEISRSKLRTYEELNDVIPVPRIYGNLEDISEDDLPVFLKPDVGQGSKGTYKANSKEEIIFYKEHDQSLLILEYLPGKEYTIDCFTNKDGTLLFCEGRERQRISNGISVKSAKIEDTRFKTIAQKINQKLAFRGVWFFQLKERVDGELVLMEIAPRVAGTMGLARGRGVNLAMLSLFDKMNMDVAVIENDYSLTIDRALQNTFKHDLKYKHVYLDFDDLVVYEDKVNPSVMSFVFQCINKGIKIHLLTKHKQDLNKTLKKYRLEGVFDDILWVQDDSEKHLRIAEKDSIFIDDSYSERKRVHDALAIPVFDAHMIECLMEKF